MKYASILILSCLSAFAQPSLTTGSGIDWASGLPSTDWLNPFTNVSGLYIELLGLSTTNWTGSTNGGGAGNVVFLDMTSYHNDFTNAINSAAPVAGNMTPPAYINNGPNGFYVMDFYQNGNVGASWRALAGKYDFETNAPNTVFMVASEVSTGTGNTLWDCATGIRLSLRIGTGASAAWFGPSGTGPPAFANTGNYFIFSTVFNGLNSVLRTNGVFCKRQGTGGPTAMGRMLIGQDIAGATAYTGKIPAVLVYNRALHSNEVAYIEGQLNTLFNLGYTITTNGGFDVGAAWGDRVVVNGGVAPSNNSKVALTALAEGMLTDGTYNKILTSSFYPTDNLIAATTPVVGYAGADPWVNHNFVSGDLTIDGLKGNTTTKYLDTSVIPTTSLSVNNTALFTYDSIIGTAVGSDIATVNSTFSTWLELDADAGGLDQSLEYNNTAGYLNTATHGAGYYCGSRTSSTVHNLYYAKAGTAHSSIASAATTGGNFATLTFKIFAFAGSVDGNPAGWSDVRSAGMGIATGLSSTDSSNIYNRLVTFRTAEGGLNP